MKIPDLNVMVALHRADHVHHATAAAWLDGVNSLGEVIGLATQSAVGLVRVATNHRAFHRPSSLAEAFTFLDVFSSHPAVRSVLVGPKHLQILQDLCMRYDVQGKTVSDAQLAALAVEHAATVVSFDRDFARFSTVKWEIPE